MLRVAPVLGRGRSAPDDEIEGRHRVAILSYGFWQRRFGGAPDVVGKTIELNESLGDRRRDAARVLLPVGSERPAEIFVPAMFTRDDRSDGGSHNYS